MTLLHLAEALGSVAVIVPVVALAVLGLTLLFAPGVTERRVHQLVALSMGTALAATVAVAVLLGIRGGEPVPLELARILALRGYHLDLALSLDVPAVVFLALDYLLCGLVGLFSASYLHQDRGFHRFYVLLLLFSVGVSLVAAARGLDLLFAGWELVGLSSALLIAFFHRRESPVRHGLRAYAVYRTTDVGLMLAVVLLHHLAGSTDIAALGPAELAAPAAALVAGFLVFGAMGKGASVPFTGWLPRAMEGPTPSSAIFYGALSIHASPFLLLRAMPLLEAWPVARQAVVGIGLLTAAHASMVGRTQCDVKATLGYAAVAQVGLMWIEVGLGFESLVLVHLAGHAVLRTWQLLRAPSLLHDRHQVAGLVGHHLADTGRHLEALLPAFLQRRLYTLALERWYLDDLLEGLIGLVRRPLHALDDLDRAAGLRLEGRSDVRSVEAPEAVASK